MNEIKKVVADRMVNSAELVTLLGEEEHIYYRRPVKKVEIPVVTYFLASRTPDWDVDQYGKIEIMMQIDIWSESEDANDEILKVIDALFYQYRATTASWDIKRFLRRGDRALPKDEEGIAQLSADWVIGAYKIAV